jgi:peroxiredoxin
MGYVAWHCWAVRYDVGSILYLGAKLMVLLQPPVCDFGKPAEGFALPGVDGKVWRLQQCRGENGLLVMFICNHCPYVKSIIDRIVRETRELQPLGINGVAIMPNDTENYPEDSFKNMQRFAAEHDFPFPYLIDRDQSVAKAYGAVCTPDFFGYNADLQLQYRGRLDESRKEAIPDVKRDLFEAMKQVAETGSGPQQQIPSMGCSIKWQAGWR